MLAGAVREVAQAFQRVKSVVHFILAEGGLDAAVDVGMGGRDAGAFAGAGDLRG